MKGNLKSILLDVGVLISIIKLQIIIWLLLNISFENTLILLFAYSLLKVLIIKRIFGCQILDGFEMNFAENVTIGCKNIVVSHFLACTILEKLDEDLMRKRILNFQENGTRMQRHPVKFLGEYYLSSNKKEKIDDHFIVIEEQIDDLEGLNKKCDEIRTLKIPKNISPWRVYYVKNYENGKAALIAQFSHLLVDGLGSIYSFYSCITDNFNGFGQTLKGVSFSKKLLIIALMLLNVPFILYKLFTIPDQKSGFKEFGKSGISHSSTWLIDLNEFKSCSKRYGVTVNDFFTSLLVMGIKDYFQEFKTEQILETTLPMRVAFTMRSSEAFKNLKGNDVGTFNIRFPLNYTSKSQHIKNIAQRFRAAKNSITPLLGYYFPSFLGVLLPYKLVTWVLSHGQGKCNIMSTSFYGPANGLTICGKKVLDIFAVGEAYGDLTCYGMCMSYHNRISICIYGDSGSIENPKRLLQLLQNHYQQLQV
jgi:hypothetical protein